MIMMLSMAMRIIHSVLQMQRDFAQGVPPLDPVGLVAFVQPDNDGNSGSGSGPLPIITRNAVVPLGWRLHQSRREQRPYPPVMRAKGAMKNKRKAV
jgi:hypothetical protein